MKKIIAILAFVFTAAAGFAKDNTVDNHKVLNAFREEFGNIQDVDWYQTENSYVAKFSLHTSKVTAHFTADGTLLATSRYISDSQLPGNVITRLIKKYPNQVIHSVVEYVTDDTTRYVIILEGATTWTTLKAEAWDGSLSVIIKLQKA
jgi:hypothetical protein